MRALLLFLPLLLAGCDPRPSSQATPAPTSTAPVPAPTPQSQPQPQPSPPAAAAPSASPVLPDDKTAAGAAAVLERYYALISARDYPGAYRLWDRAGQASGKSEQAFARGFADTARSAVEVTGPGVAEGAAGSSFLTLPVRIEAVAADGTVRRFAGDYTLRRVNDVDGATPEQLRWHIAGATLKQAA